MMNPAELGDTASLIRELYARLAAQDARIAAMEGARSLSCEEARVSAYAGGAQVTVQYPNYAAGENPQSATLTGPTRVVPFMPPWTPGVGSNVLVLNSPVWSGIWNPISAF